MVDMAATLRAIREYNKLNAQLPYPFGYKDSFRDVHRDVLLLAHLEPCIKHSLMTHVSLIDYSQEQDNPTQTVEI